MNEGLNAIHLFFFRWAGGGGGGGGSGPLPLLKNNGKACERRKSGRERAEP